MKTVITIAALFAMAVGVMAQNALPEPKHGGLVGQIGDIGYVEVVQEVIDGLVIFYFTDTEGNDLGLSDAPKMNLVMLDEDGMQVRVQFVMNAVNLADGKAHEFMAIDEQLITEHLHGRVAVKFNGKTYQAPVPHVHNPK
jgi:hypothetical protein